MKKGSRKMMKEEIAAADTGHAKPNPRMIPPKPPPSSRPATLLRGVIAAANADTLWSAELNHRFGRDACNIRYMPQGHGEPGSRLHAFHQAFRAASSAHTIAFEAYCKACRAHRAVLGPEEQAQSDLSGKAD